MCWNTYARKETKTAEAGKHVEPSKLLWEVEAIPAGYNTKFCATWLELITISIVTIRSIWHKLCGRLFTFCEFWQNYWCQHYIATCEKKLYRPRCTSTFSALKYTAVKFYSNLSAIYKKSCTQTFPPIFGLSQFSTAISRKLWHHRATNNGSL